MTISLYFLITLNWNKFIKNSLLERKYDGIQRLHEGEVPRLGGFVFILSLIIFYLASSELQNLLFLEAILLSSIPIIFIGLKEDLFQNTFVYSRLVCMIFSSLIFFTIYPVNFPSMEIYFIQLINNSIFLQYIFFITCLIVVMNGNNMIDGAHGLMSLANLFQCLSLFYLMYFTNDYSLFIYLSIIIFALLIFLIFNYPFGKIFMGDTGAYFFGFIIANLIIVFFGNHPEITPWYAAIILFYPAFELFFSFLRRALNNKNPLKADVSHLHSLAYFYVKSKFPESKNHNALVTPFLLIILLLPLINLYLTINFGLNVFFSLIIFTFLYFMYFIYFAHKLRSAK